MQVPQNLQSVDFSILYPRVRVIPGIYTAVDSSHTLVVSYSVITAGYAASKHSTNDEDFLLVRMATLASAMACMQMLRAGAAPLGVVAIWNYVGGPISVHCHDQFTDLVQQDLPHGTDYIFTFDPNPDGTTLYSCSFVWGLNRTQEFPVWAGEKFQTNPRTDCDAGSFKCLYKVTPQGFFLASPALGHGGPSNCS